MKRRSFFALLAAPAIVRASSLMKLAPLDDSGWLQRYLNVHHTIPRGSYRLDRPLLMPPDSYIARCEFEIRGEGVLVFPGRGKAVVRDNFFDCTRASPPAGCGLIFPS